MEDLMEIVAASFARHGIECPVGDSDSKVAWGRTPSSVQAERSSAPASKAAVQTTSTIGPTALPDHNYRKSLQGDPAP